MDAALRELNGKIDLATQRLLDDARTLTDPDLQVPSLLPAMPQMSVCPCSPPVPCCRVVGLAAPQHHLPNHVVS